ncbi:hypothetical protein [Bradyrhizobium zhanjiangense]|uniref:hypothetical protein n=1 Tax=Bradyrhizobium zhanjiangense TaxID=1325107 RepID=UPI0010088610|nr:hypothetical protein [Bradyrhizobium zhanjiangense]
MTISNDVLDMLYKYRVTQFSSLVAQTVQLQPVERQLVDWCVQAAAARRQGESATKPKEHVQSH